MPTKRPSEVSARTLDEVVIRRDTTARELLTVLSGPLVSAGLTPKRFAELAKQAFVQSAASTARLRNGRINQSKVAVLTGLTRNEVKRLLAAGSEASEVRTAQLTPVERVIAAWLSVTRYSSSSGIPRRLKITGKSPSFVELVRTYGGDVTSRAVLDEMLRLGVVQLTDKKNLVALTLGPKSAWSRTSVMCDEALPLIAEAARAAASFGADGRSSAVSQLRFYANNPLELSILRERLAPAVASFVNGIREALRAQNSVRAKDAKYELRLNVLLTDRTSEKRKKLRVRVGNGKGVS